MIDDILTVVWKERKMLFREQVSELLGRLSGEQAFLVIAGVLVMLTSVVQAGAMARFQRSRLILD